VIFSKDVYNKLPAKKEEEDGMLVEELSSRLSVKIICFRYAGPCNGINRNVMIERIVLIFPFFKSSILNLGLDFVAKLKCLKFWMDQQ